MWFVEFSISLILLGITIQDLKKRSVYALWFPALWVLFVINHFLTKDTVGTVLQSVLLNLGFLGVQFLILTIYFSWKADARINITHSLIGWGDVLLLICIAFYLPVFNFVAFYVLSLIAVLLSWIVWLKVSQTTEKHIPMAGLQAAFFGGLLLYDWFSASIDLTTDTWLLHYLSLWNI